MGERKVTRTHWLRLVEGRTAQLLRLPAPALELRDPARAALDEAAPRPAEADGAEGQQQQPATLRSLPMTLAEAHRALRLLRG